MRSVSSKRCLQVLLLVCLCLTTGAAQVRVAIKAGRLLDGTGSPAVEGAVIIVQGDRIEAVGKASSVPIASSTKVIDLSGDTVMAGMINGHDHPTIRAFTGPDVDREGPNSLIEQLMQMGEEPALQAARGVRNLRVDLLSGVTTEYVVGEVKYNDVYLKRMVDTGVIPGPRIYISGPWLMPTGGYDPIPATDGPSALRVLVRKNVERGAHHVKVVVSREIPTGPGAGHLYGPGATNFTKEELESVVDEAHRLGVKVTAHAIDADSIRFALEAGVDSVQHADGLTPEIDDLFVKHQAGFINTYVAMAQGSFTRDDFRFLDAQASSPQAWVDHGREILDRVVKENRQMPFGGGTLQEYLTKRYNQLKLAKDKQIPIAVGTDNMQGLLDLEVEHLVNAGFTPLEALSAVNGMGAKVLGIDKEVGTIEKGKYADIISIRGKPDQDIRDLSKVNFVMVGGKNFTGLSFR